MDDMENAHGGPMSGRTVLVTGGTGGIGLATALGLARLGARVAVTGRDRGRADDAARAIHAAGGAEPVVFIADMSSQAQVRRLADDVAPGVAPDRCAGQQRGRVLELPTRHRRRPGAHVRGQPSRSVPAHPPAVRAADHGWSRPGRHRRLPCTRPGPDRLRGPPGRTRLLRCPRLQPVQARQRRVRLRARPTACGHRRHRQRAPPRRGEHGLRCRGPGPGAAAPGPASCGRS